MFLKLISYHYYKEKKTCDSFYNISNANIKFLNGAYNKVN